MLVNNAGILATDREMSADGIESCLAVGKQKTYTQAQQCAHAEQSRKALLHALPIPFGFAAQGLDS